MNEQKITLEILGQLGFDGNSFKRRFKRATKCLTIYFEDGMVSIQDDDWYQENLPHIKYVDQIQNLYLALSGMEL